MKNIAEYIDALVNSPRFKSQVAAHHRDLGSPGSSSAAKEVLPLQLSGLLGKLGIDKLYSHQCEALAAIEKGMHTAVATPTASGKTLIYHIPLLRTIERQPRARALYIFPLKALAQDQLTTFRQWTQASSCQPAPDAAIYDGDTSSYRRKKIRQCPPSVLMTNPEMVHLSLLPFHERWGDLIANLHLVVIDEVHTYRGMLGNHMAQVLRRLRRVCKYHGSSPVFIFTSATVNNPAQLASELLGMPVHAVTESGAPKGVRQTVLIDPPGSPAQTAIDLIKAALARQLRTIVYTQSRKMAELVAVWAQQRAGRWSERISVYRAGLMPEDRRDIEQRLRSGQLLAVVTTSALELGIDIGDLDLCILVGYPGSMVSTLQRSGRVGRQGQASALIMVASENALDQYYIDHPRAFFQGVAEAAVINAFNGVALEAHLACAAAELPLSLDESWLEAPEVSVVVSRMERSGLLKRTADGTRLHSRRKRPHMSVNLRGTGQRYQIVDALSGSTIGEIEAHRLYRETHPGAIYLSQGRTYRVESVDSDKNSIRVLSATVDYYTKVRSHTDVEIIHLEAHKSIGRTNACIGRIKITDSVSGYDLVRTATGEKIRQHFLDVPPVSFETQGLWFDIPSDLCRAVQQEGHDLMGSLHAAEHAAISMMPLLVLADRTDVGGLSTSFHPQTGSAAIFIYDGVPGGAGFSEQAYALAGELVEVTREAIERCPCEAGCPACVHSPKCGSGNHPIDKVGAASLLTLMPEPGPSASVAPQMVSMPEPEAPLDDLFASHPKTFGVFDLETQRSALEVGGWHMANLMRVSCGVVYDSRDDRFVVYQEKQIEQLIGHLQRLDLVVGFNSKRFDYKVLNGYSDFDFLQLPAFDILEAVKDRLGFRLSLDHIAEATLGQSKSGSGLDALEWWQQGRMDLIIDYCRKDVLITRDLYLFARAKGYLLYREKDGEKFRIPMSYRPPTLIVQG